MRWPSVFITLLVEIGLGIAFDIDRLFFFYLYHSTSYDTIMLGVSVWILELKCSFIILHRVPSFRFLWHINVVAVRIASAAREGYMNSEWGGICIWDLEKSCIVPRVWRLYFVYI